MPYNDGLNLKIVCVKPMEIEQINSIQSQIKDLSQRTQGLRGYL